MDDSDMLAAVRASSGLPDNHPDYTDARIRLELNDCLRTVFARSVVNSRGGYWLHSTTQDLAAAQAYYRIPFRALAGGLQRIEVRATSSSRWQEIREVASWQVGTLDTDTSALPWGYWLEADHVRLVGVPSSSDADIRFWYYVRPSRLMQEQITGAVYDGTITSINTSTRVALMAVTPVNRDTASAITTSTLVDVVSAKAGHDLHVIGATLTNVTSNTSVTFASGTDLSRVAVGDVVRAQDQSDWPMLPQEFHRTLADATAAIILAGGIGAVEKAGGLSGKVAKDIERLEDLLRPRVKDNVRKLLPRYGELRRGRGRGRWPIAPSS